MARDNERGILYCKERCWDEKNENKHAEDENEEDSIVVKRTLNRKFPQNKKISNIARCISLSWSQKEKARRNFTNFCRNIQR